jgi:hypothetical protein
MTQLDSKASLVGIGDTDTQQVNLGVENDGRTLARMDDRWIRVKIDPDDGGEMEVVNQTLGAVVYRNGDTAIAYQDGSVWKRTGDGATMVSPPEFHFRETTLTLPLVVVGGEGAARMNDSTGHEHERGGIRTRGREVRNLSPYPLGHTLATK